MQCSAEDAFYPSLLVELLAYVVAELGRGYFSELEKKV